MKRQSIQAILCAVLALGVISCASRIPLSRNLPEWVESVYVPMFGNETAEPGLEELATRLTIVEFLADGRLSVDSPQYADLVVDVTITDYIVTVEDTSDDKLPRLKEALVVAGVSLYEPSNRETPFFNLGPVTTRMFYNADLRSLSVKIEPEVKKRLMRRLAINVVRRVITGYRRDGTSAYDQSQEPDVELEL